MILKNFANSALNFNTLVDRNLYSIVIKYQPKRSLFDKTTYNPQWIPRNSRYSKHRKPRQEMWTDENKFYPVLIPPMIPNCNPRGYLKYVVQEQQRIKSFRKKEFLLQDIRAGDIVDISYQDTFQNDKVSTYRCLVIGFRRKNSYSAAIEVAIRFGGMNLKSVYLIHSPKLKNLKLISKGSGNLQSVIRFGWKKLGRQKLSSPRIRRGVIKRRGVSQKKIKSRQRAVIFDRVGSDSFKKIL